MDLEARTRAITTSKEKVTAALDARVAKLEALDATTSFD